MQRAECLEYCQISAVIMELMEYQIIRGRVTLVTHEERNKSLTVAPCGNDTEGSIHETTKFLDNSPDSLFGTSDVMRPSETKVDQEMEVVGN